MREVSIPIALDIMCCVAANLLHLQSQLSCVCLSVGRVVQLVEVSYGPLSGILGGTREGGREGGREGEGGRYTCM